jgi:tetratricopeptide (TPR) repeat protein
MRLAPLLAACLVLVPATAVPQTRFDPDFARWRAAVQAHQPGTLTASTRTLGDWPWDRLGPVVDELKVRGTVDDLFRGAALYLDLAIEVPLAERPVYPARGGAVYSRDGRPVSTHRLDSQIWTARALVVRALGRAGSGERERTLARSWFRAVTAIFAQRLNFADLQPHLAEALKHLPDEPGVLFDAGCAAETLASPLIQATLTAGQQPSTLGTRLPSAPGAAQAAGTRPASFLATAEKHYRAALAVSPGDRETRVRLGRVLANLRRPVQALAELQAAGKASGSPIVQYFNWLFLGDVLTDLGRPGDALTAFSEAAALYPDSDAARLGVSRVHSERGDPAAARRALGRFAGATPGADIGADPRWQYNRCLGRDAHAVYSAYVEQFRKEFR